MNNQTKIVVLIGGGVLVLTWFKRPKGTVTTSEGFDLSAYGGPTSYPQPIIQFAQAIARQEGFYVRDSIPARAHNPGDLKIPGKATLPGTSITQFASDDEGWQALYKQLWSIVTGKSNNYNLSMTIEEMARVWTATEQSAWAGNVATFSGATPGTPLWQVLT
jgi:hypothetical protein